MTEYKILFTGTMGAGKTTAIAAISELPPLGTDVSNTDRSLAKERTTVGLDFGVLTLDTGDRLRLFGTPGQTRFDFLWTVLARNALGVVLLCDNSRPDPLSDLKTYVDGFESVLESVPCVVGVGRTDTHARPDVDDYAAVLEARGLLAPVVAVDVRRRDDVLMLVDMLLVQIEAQLAGVADD